MSIFGSIMSTILSHATAAEAPAGAAPAPSGAGQPATSSSAPAPSANAPGGGNGQAPASAALSLSAATPSGPVDVAAVLTRMAASEGGGANWQTSIVDLLKLLHLDSSLAARKELAQELGVHVGQDGSAEENIALHRAVMQKIAEHGGTMPDSLKGLTG